jgi:hypothetical protein
VSIPDKAPQRIDAGRPTSHNGGVTFTIPGRLAAACRSDPDRVAWLARLPATLRALEHRWSLTAGTPFDGEEVSCAWVAPVALASGQPAVLKLGMPHMEGEQESGGLRFWNGDPTVRLLDADDHLGAMLLERCEPGLRCARCPSRSRITSSRASFAGCGARQRRRTPSALCRQ